MLNIQNIKHFQSKNTTQTTTSISTILKKIIASNQKSFFSKVFNTLHPGKSLYYDWHIELIIRYLHEVEKGVIKRLIINIPPRCLKSMCSSVFWPAWLLANDPSRKIITASYSKDLGLKHSQDCRFVMQSHWYRSFFPDAAILKTQNTKSKFLTKLHGFRFTTSVNSTLTGEGADFIIVDDPQTPSQIFSKTGRQKTIRWFEQTLMSRLNDQKNGAIVVVMQRLHTNDLSGHLLRSNQWELLSIPIINNKAIHYKCGNYVYQRTANEILDSRRYNAQTLQQLQHELGDYAFNAQYKQEPHSAESSLIKKSWFKYFDCQSLLSSTPHMQIYQSWDCAIKDGAYNDYTVCLTVAHHNDSYYILDIFRGKVEYPKLKNIILHYYNKYQPKSVLIEDKASGQQIIQELRLIQHKQEESRTPMQVIPVTPKYDKVTRLMLVSPIIANGQVILPSNTPWVGEFEDELLDFPHAKHDDQVDALTQFLHWINCNSSHCSKIIHRL